jgi:hypothetical protein
MPLLLGSICADGVIAETIYVSSVAHGRRIEMQFEQESLEGFDG